MAKSNFLPTEYQSFIHMSRYSRWKPEEGRRETWSETVQRLIDFFAFTHIDVPGLLSPVLLPRRVACMRVDCVWASAHRTRR